MNQLQLIRDVSQRALQHVSEVQAIARAIGIPPDIHFSYSKFYKGTRIFFCGTDDSLIRDYVTFVQENNNIQHFIEHTKVFALNDCVFSMHDSHISIRNNAVLRMILDHGMTHSIAIKTQDANENTDEIFGFYGVGIADLGMQKMKDHLQRHMQQCLAFKEKANAYILQNQLMNKSITEFPHCKFESRKSTYFNDVEIKKYYIGKPFGSHYLTKKEYQCLQLLFLGLTTKQISIKLGNISYRTVEKHWIRIKEKSNCDNLAVLRQALLENVLFMQQLKMPDILV